MIKIKWICGNLNVRAFRNTRQSDRQVFCAKMPRFNCLQLERLHQEILGSETFIRWFIGAGADASKMFWHPHSPWVQKVHSITVDMV